jgi:hypothetical protein
MRYHPNRLRQIAGKNYELMNVFQQLVTNNSNVNKLPTFLVDDATVDRQLKHICQFD